MFIKQLSLRLSYSKSLTAITLTKKPLHSVISLFARDQIRKPAIRVVSQLQSPGLPSKQGSSAISLTIRVSLTRSTLSPFLGGGCVLGLLSLFQSTISDSNQVLDVLLFRFDSWAVDFLA